MQVSRWGNSLAIRLPAELVKALALKEGDEIEIAVDPDRSFRARRPLTREEWLENMKQFRGWLPADFKFNRDEANER